MVEFAAFLFVAIVLLRFVGAVVRSFEKRREIRREKLRQTQIDSWPRHGHGTSEWYREVAHWERIGSGHKQ